MLLCYNISQVIDMNNQFKSINVFVQSKFCLYGSFLMYALKKKHKIMLAFSDSCHLMITFYLLETAQASRFWSRSFFFKPWQLMFFFINCLYRHFANINVMNESRSDVKSDSLLGDATVMVLPVHKERTYINTLA